MQLTSDLVAHRLERARPPARDRVRGQPRTGTTLVELTVVVVLMAFIVGGLLSIVDRQHRLYRGHSAGSAVRTQVREAAEILPGELRALSPGGGDVVNALDSLLEINSTIGSGVVCERGDSWIALVPLRPRLEPALGSELIPPEAGDAVHLLLADAADPGGDRWPAFTILETARDGGVCAGGPFISPSDAGRPRLRLHLDAPVAPGVREGVPVRITRGVRYSLYRSSDRRWYLGVNERTGARWSGIQPVSGPYAAYAPSRGGLQFEYWSADGERLASPAANASLARIALTVRGEAVRHAGAAPESAVVQVALRNRSR